MRSHSHQPGHLAQIAAVSSCSLLISLPASTAAAMASAARLRTDLPESSAVIGGQKVLHKPTGPLDKPGTQIMTGSLRSNRFATSTDLLT